MPGTARGRDPAVEEEFLGSLYKGGELLAAGKIVEAREHLEKAHELSPKNEKAQNLLGLAYFKLGLFDQAAHVYELLVRENPADPTLRVNLGLVYLKTNNLERAVREFETATDLEPGHKKAHNYLGLALAQQGEYGKAREHFVAAGSDQMAEKMEKAQSARAPTSQPSSPSLTVPSAPPATSLAMTNAPAVVVSRPSGLVPPPLPLTKPVAPPAPPAAAQVAQEEAIEVMSDDELPPEEGVADVEVETAPLTVPPSRGSQPSLNSDWGAQLPSPSAPAAEPAADEEMRFAEDEGPASLPMNDAPLIAIDSPAEPVDVAVEPLPATSGDMPMLDATAVEVDAQPAWLTTSETTAEPVGGEIWVTETVADVPLTNPTPAPEVPPAPSEETWNTGASVPSDGWEPPQLEQVLVVGEHPTEQPAEPTATIQDFQGAESLAQDPHWVAQPLSQAVVPEAYAEAVQQEPYQQAFDDPSAVSEGAIEQYAEASATASWEAPSQSEQTQLYEVPAEAQSYEAPPEAQPYEQYEPPAEALAYEAAPYDEQPVDAQAYEAPSPQLVDQAQGYEQPVESVEAQPSEQSAEPPPYEQQPLEQPAEIHHFEPPQPVEEASWEQPVEPIAPEPAPIPLQLEHPYVPTVETADDVPEGTFAPMHTQRLVDLGATAGWVQQPDAGPFQLGPQGLAVTVTGEMLVRMTGLVAVVGSVQVSAEMRRKRGRPTQEPFGVGPAQVQRVKGNGVLYLEAGKSRFHSVDLTDQPGSSVDDEGAYLREELLFAFEEAVSFENGRLAADGNLAVDLVHLKGHGQVLLQLDGSLKAMAIPAGAPMVIPLHRLVGWFGRVTPRLMGFGGQGAVELTGDGFALLGTPST